MNAKVSEWPKTHEEENEATELHRQTSSNYLKFIAWWIGISMSVILAGGGFFITAMFGQVESMKVSLEQMNARGIKLARRMAFIEVVNRELAEKNGINLKTLENVRDLQEADDSKLNR